MTPNPASSGPTGKRQDSGVELQRLVSGGQTGADRAALDFAIQHGIPHGGWCPRGRSSEAGPIGAGYALRETPSAGYAQRTEWNVRDSDGTVIFSLAPALSGGSLATQQFAVVLGKPCLHLSGPEGELQAAARLARFIAEHRIRALNVAGPRSSQEPAIGGFVRAVLARVLAAGHQPTTSRGQTPAG